MGISFSSKKKREANGRSASVLYLQFFFSELYVVTANFNIKVSLAFCTCGAFCRSKYSAIYTLAFYSRKSKELKSLDVLQFFRVTLETELDK